MVRPRDLEDIALRLSERSPIDWDREEASSSSDLERRWVRNLRVVDAIAEVARADDLDEATRTILVPTAPLPSVETPRHSTEASPESAAESPASWGHLSLLEKVGSGGFGEVYRAWDTRLNRQVALKLLTPPSSVPPRSANVGLSGASHGDDAELARVLEEARLLARVEHPNVVRIHGAEKHDGRVGIWMEFVEGTDLYSLGRERGPLAVEEVASLGVDLCAALAAVHAAGIVHQDVKPQNVVRAMDGRTVLMDFGAGRRRRLREDGPTPGLTGTPRYMAPELFTGGEASPQSDQYSVGATLLYLATGRAPLEGDLQAVRAAHVEGRTPTLTSLDPALPAGFRSLVDRALAPQRADRFASVEEFGAALDAIRSERPAVAPVASDSAFAPSAAPGPRPGVPRAAQRTAPRGLWRAAAVAAVLAVAVFAASRLWLAPTELAAELRFQGLRDGAPTEFSFGEAVGTGDQLEVQLELTRDAYVYVINRDSHGSATVLFPMAGAPIVNPLPGGRPLVLPGEVDGEHMGWGIGGEEGIEDFLVVASAERLEDFETVLDRYAAVDVGGGLSVRPIDDLAMNVLTRGVTGLVPFEGEEPARDGDLFAMAEQLAERTGRVWLGRMSLRNTGP